MRKTLIHVRRILLPYLQSIVLTAMLALPAAALAPVHFNAPRNFVTPEMPVQVITMDWDGDGDTDAAVRTTLPLDQPAIHLFENPGDGTLVFHSSLVLSGSSQVTAADFNQDGLIDLCHTYPTGLTTSAIGVYLGTGPFTFAPRAPLALDFPSKHLCIGNLDNQKGPDLIVKNDLLPEVSVLLGDGAGGFTRVGAFETESLERDVDGDGERDTQGDFEVLDLVSVDVDADGDDDLLYTNSMKRLLSPPIGEPKLVSNIVCLINQGDGTLGPFMIAIDGFGKDIGAGDLNGDGILDIATTGTSLSGPDKDDVMVILGNGDGTFQAPRRYPSGGGVDGIGALRVMDVDGDADLDVGILHYGPVSGSLTDPLPDHWALLRNDGSGSLGTPEIAPTGADVLDLAFAQLDGEAGPEAITVSGEDARLSVHYNVAGSYPGPAEILIDDPATPAHGDPPTDIACGDINNDGFLDLAVTTDPSRLLGDGPDTLVILEGGTGGISNQPTIMEINEGPTRLIIDQMVEHSSAYVSVLCSGSGLFGDPPGVALGFAQAQGLTDPFQFIALNGEPVAEALLGRNQDGQYELAVLRYRDEGVTAGISLVRVGSNGTTSLLPGGLILGNDDVLVGDTRLPDALASADMNNDGLRDLIVASWNPVSRPGKITVFLNEGGSSFSQNGEYDSADRVCTDIIAADFDGDGLNDVAYTTTAGADDAVKDGSVEVLRNTGQGGLVPFGTYLIVEGPSRIHAAQIDDNPGVDLVVSCDGTNEVTILFNDGNGGFSTHARYLTGGSTDAIAVGDFDQDGCPDIAACHDQFASSPGERHTGTVTILSNRNLATDTVQPVPAPDDGGTTTDGDGGGGGGGGGGCFISGLLR